jgi:hypothetical protein
MTRGQHPKPLTKAYRNISFLTSPEARTIRLLSEYLEPEARFAKFHVEDTIVFFGSARSASGDPHRRPDGRDYYEEAEELAYRITLWSKGLSNTRRRFIVCSGGGPGIMEAANRGASRARGLSVGLGISLPYEQTINRFVSHELAFEFHYFFMRKFWFVYLAKALVVFPGGYGTLDELFELLTLIQTGKASKPRRVVLYGASFWERVVDWDLLVEWEVISPEDLELFQICDSTDEAYSYLTEELSALYDLSPEP